MKHFLNSRYFSELMHLRSGTFCSFHFIDDKSEFRKIRKLVQVVGFEVREQGPQSPGHHFLGCTCTALQSSGQVDHFPETHTCRVEGSG